MKLCKCFMLIGVLSFFVFVLGAGSLESFNGVFFEGFESGSFVTNGWTSSGGATSNWVVLDSDVYSGMYSAYVSDTDAESILSTGINTSGYGAINFSFWYMTSALDSGEYLRVDWYNGTNWINVLDLTAINVGYTFANFSLPSSASNNEDFAIRFRCDVNRNNEFCAIDNVSVSGVELLGIDLVDIYLLNQGGARIDELNNTAVETSNLMVVNFSVNHLDSIDSWYLNYSANGTNGCALGNKQSSVCYLYPNWIQFINNTETETFDAIKDSASDYIRVSLLEGEVSNFSFVIDEHYNPNVFKWYESDFNFSDDKWQNETNYRVTGDNMLKFEFNSSMIPLDMDFARIDLRVAYNGTPEKLEMFICNSSYSNQDPHVYSGCQLIEEKMYYELEEGGTKFKAFFSKNLIDEIGDFKYAILHSAEINPSEYYYIKTYKATNENYSIHWEYSNDYGSTWNITNESYASQININWFYNGNDPTAFIYRFWANTTSGEEKYLEGNLTWDIDPANNYEPIVVFVSLSPSEYLELPYNITFSISDTNDDELNVTLDLYKNSTLNATLFSEINGDVFNYYWNDSIEDGFYSLFLNVCETNTTDLFCRNATREIAVDSEAPFVSLISPAENSIYYDNISNEIELAVNVTDLGVQGVYFNLTYPNGTIFQINLSNEEGDKYNESFEIPMLAGRYNITAVAMDYLERVNDSETTYFVLNDVSSPEVILEYPYGNNVYNNDSVEISASVLDSGEIDSIIATVLYPNSSIVNLSNFTQSIQTDNFNIDTMNDVWEFRNDSVSEGQICYSDINNEIEGSLFLSVSGEGVSGSSSCGVSSLDRLDGDYDVYLDFNVISMESDSIFVFRVNSVEELYSAGRRLFISLRQVDSQRYYRFGYMNGTELVINQIATSDSYGKMRIKRYNSSEGDYLYDAYYWDNDNNVWIKMLDAVSVSGSSRTQYAQIYLESLGSNGGGINVSVNEFNVQSEDNYFTLFNPPVLEGVYNVSLFVNDSYGNVNNTEETWFNLSILNTEPSNPIIYHPSYGDYVSSEEYISWSKIVDDEGNSLKFNISLLNLDYSLNSTIVYDYGNSESLDYLWNTSEFVDGEYKIRVVVYENETVEGYSSNSSAFLESFFIDNTIPEVEFLNGTTENGTYESSEISFNVSFSDLNLDNCTVFLYKDSVFFNSSSSENSSFFGNFSELSYGSYELFARVYDLAGNFVDTETRSVVLDFGEEDSEGDTSGYGGVSVIRISEDSEKEYIKLIREGGRVSFLFKNKIHFLEVLNISKDFVLLRIYSDVFEKWVFVGGVWGVDLNGDMEKDVSITLNSVDSGVVNLSIGSPSPLVEVDYPRFAEEDVSDYDELLEDKEGRPGITGNVIGNFLKSSGFYWILFVLVLLVVLFYVVRFFNKYENRIRMKDLFCKLCRRCGYVCEEEF